MTRSILTELHDGILTVTINRPETLNALTGEAFQDIGSAVAEAAGSARAFVLTGSDRAFSSGADLQESTQRLDLAEANGIIRSLIDLPVPTIAAVSGPAAGIGCSLALACDYVVMSEKAYLMLAFAKIGLMPDGGATALVAASAGRHRAMQMALTAQKVFAPQALDWGLASEVVAPGEQLSRAHEVAATFAHGAPLGLARTKHAVNEATLTSLGEAFAREVEGQNALRATADFAEGVAAFTEKRDAQFTGQ
ncbi:enoyl-CoA hydratase [Brevibacterium sanguinis]|uniref:Enoyl-CoA hydratase n=2 Tax=Brevibacterium TaxID=1696 RepID=A0A366IIZ3_9MICO|nr:MULTISPECIES: enoyl-CoA hydratase-related protein [Brevibacterium]RBP65487.1 enoyl-CoA hydratase [Brevibacterium sanguinis]RBP72121.1 enoyl-CoA hydratase [Brevibacterium celere]